MPLDEQQKALRRQGITASEIAILAGFSRKSTPALIYADKRYGVEIEASIPMRLGDKLEQPIAEIYAEDTGTVLLPVTTLRHPKRPFAIATPDRAVFAAKPSRAVVDAKGRLTAPSECEEPPFKLLQVKSRSWRMAREYGTPGTDEVLDEEHCQVTYEMGVSGVHLCDVGVLFDKDRFETYTVPFAPAFFEALYEIGERFYIDHVRAGVPPPPDASERYAEALATMYPRETSAQLEPLPAELETLVERFALFRKVEKLVKTEKKRLQQVICVTLGNRAGFTGPFGKLTWKRTRDGEKVNWRGVANDAITLSGMLLNALGPTMPAADREKFSAVLRELVKKNTSPKLGYRRIHFRPPDDFLPARQLLGFNLEGLTEGEDEENEDKDERQT